MVHEESSYEDHPFRGSSRPACAGAVGLVALAIVLPTSAQQNNAKQAKTGGVITSTSALPDTSRARSRRKGPEAGVWVIAETKDLGTNMIKTVVTDDQGRYLLPDLPAVNYKVWVRGYGIVDSTPVNAKPSANSSDSESDVRQDPAGSRESLSRRLLAVAAGAAAQESCFPERVTNPTPTRTATA